MTKVLYTSWLTEMVDDWNSRGKKGNSCPLLQLTMTAIQSHQVDTSAPCRSGCSHFVADCKFHHSGSSACGMVLPGCTSCSAGTFHNYITKIYPSEPAFLQKLHQTLSLSLWVQHTHSLEDPSFITMFVRPYHCNLARSTWSQSTSFPTSFLADSI